MTKEQLPSAVDDAADVMSGLTPEEKKRKGRGKKKRTERAFTQNERGRSFYL